MLMNSFPRTQGTLSRESYLTLLLLGLISQAGGEIRISAIALERLDSGGTLLVDWDLDAQQIVLRSGTPALVVAPVRGTGWTTASTTPVSPSSPSDDPKRHRVMTEDQILQDLAKRIQNDNLREWRRQGAAAVANMPEPES
jgi:hypothetical protein